MEEKKELRMTTSELIMVLMYLIVNKMDLDEINILTIFIWMKIGIITDTTFSNLFNIDDYWNKLGENVEFFRYLTKQDLLGSFMMLAK
jgi:hypothetical protein